MRFKRKDTQLLVENWRRFINEGEEENSSIAKELNFDEKEKEELNKFVKKFAGQKVPESVFGSDIGRKFYNFETFDGFKDGGSEGCMYAGRDSLWPTVTDLTGFTSVLTENHEINYGDIKVNYKIYIEDQPSGWSMSQNDELGAANSSSYRLNLNASIGNTTVLGQREDKRNKESPRRMLILAQRTSVMQGEGEDKVEKLDKSEPMKNVCLVSVIYLDSDRKK